MKDLSPCKMACRFVEPSTSPRAGRKTKGVERILLSVSALAFDGISIVPIGQNVNRKPEIFTFCTNNA